jgi:hypothetical protein
MTKEELLRDPVINETGPLKVALLRGPVYAEDATTWGRLVHHREALELYFLQISLELKINEDFGYAYLDQLGPDQPGGKFGTLFARRPLGFEPTVIGVALRDELLRRETTRVDEGPVVMPLEEIVDLVRAFIKDTADEVKERERWRAAVLAFAKLGFLKDLQNEREEYQLRPIIRARFDLETLQELKAALIRHAAKTSAE